MTPLILCCNRLTQFNFWREREREKGKVDCQCLERKKERLKQAKGSKKLSFQVTKKTAIIIIISLIINDKISPFICSCVKLVFCLQYCMNVVLSDPMTLT